MTDLLVLRALGLGDLLTGVPALRALRTGLPRARLTLAAPAQLAELVALVDAVDVLLPTSGPGVLRWPGPRPAVAVNLHGCGPQSIADLRGVEPRVLFSYAHPKFADLVGPAWSDRQHEVDRWCRLVEFHGMAARRADLALPHPGVPSPAPAAAVVHPGAAYPARCWPWDRYARVAAALAADGHQVVLTGVGAEQALAERIAGAAGLAERAVLAGRTGLASLAALVADAALVICGDTGVGHLATAYGTPSVLLFGPTPPARWGPPDRPQHVVLWTGDTGDPFAVRPDPGLLRITEPDVLTAATQALRAGHPVSRGG